MEIGERRREGLVILEPVGRIDNETSDEFQARLVAAVTSDATACVVDFSAVPYVTSAGMRALMAAARAKTTGRRFAVAALGRVVQDIFDVTRFTYIVPVFGTVAEAEAALSAPP